MKYFTIERIQQAIEHLEHYHSKWVIVPLVFAINGVNEDEEVNITAPGQAGADEFLQHHFSGALIGLPSYARGVNSLRPKFKELIATLRTQGHEDDYVLHQKQGLWANAYSSRGYREMVTSGIVTSSGNSKFKLEERFWDIWAENLPETFNFEDLLVWLYAFDGFSDEIDTWSKLFTHFQERYLGEGNTFPKGYDVRFFVEDPDGFDLMLLDERPSNEDFRRALLPSMFRAGITGSLTSEIAEDDDILIRVRELLNDGFAGVIFTGPPGTSKSWYASQVGIKLAEGDPKRIRFIQFHASYQYEDFVEGFIPVEGGGFKLEKKHLLKMCKTAEEAEGKLCVLVIDELSRSDPARVFGEALTYIEMTKRNKKFRISSGKEISIPENLIFLATMNPVDKGVDEVDAALERRFAKIAMNPNSEILRTFLEDKEMEDGLRNRVLGFFNFINGNGNKNQMSRVGHAYLYDVADEAALERLWQNQLYFHFEKAFRLDPEGFEDVKNRWSRIFPPKVGAPAEAKATKVTVAEPAPEEKPTGE